MDLLLWMIGMPETVQAVIRNTSHDKSQLEDLSIAILSYPGGGLAQVTSSIVHHGEEQQLVFQGRRRVSQHPGRCMPLLRVKMDSRNGIPGWRKRSGGIAAA